MKWKKLRNHLLILIAAIAVILIGYNISVSRAKKLNPESELKYNPTNPMVGAMFTVEVKVIGSHTYGSPSVEVFYTSNKKTVRQFCSTTQGRPNETGCQFVQGLNRYDGDEVIIEIHRMFALAKPSERMMLRRKYTIVRNTVLEKDTFTDPNGFGNGSVSLRVGEPFTQVK